jgi:hypothetical protein
MLRGVWPVKTERHFFFAVSRMCSYMFAAHTDMASSYDSSEILTGDSNPRYRCGHKIDHASRVP